MVGRVHVSKLYQSNTSTPDVSLTGRERGERKREREREREEGREGEREEGTRVLNTTR